MAMLHKIDGDCQGRPLPANTPKQPAKAKRPHLRASADSGRKRNEIRSAFMKWRSRQD
jgi:hypothetical protein